MASGCFPLSEATSDGIKLLQAEQLIQEVFDEYRDAVYAGDLGQWDNTASDGGALAELRLAVELLQRNVRKAQK